MTALNEYFEGQAALKDLKQKAKDGSYAPYAELEPVLEEMKAQGFEVTINTGVYAFDTLDAVPILYSSLKIEKNDLWICYSHNLGNVGYSERTSDRYKLIDNKYTDDLDVEYIHEAVSDLSEVAARIGYWQEKNNDRFVPAQASVQRSQGWAGRLAEKMGFSLG